jgi:hypothetical protein
MNKLITGIISISLLILTTSNVTAKPKTKKTEPIDNTLVEPQKIGGTITGKQYFVLGGGAKAIPDNQVFYIACNETNCDAIEQGIITGFSSRATTYNAFDKRLEDLNLERYSCMSNTNYLGCKEKVSQSIKSLEATRPMHQGQYLRETLISLVEKSSMVRTNFEGNYSLKCQSSKCLVFGSGQAGKVTAYWIKTVDANSNFDLTNSNSLFDTDSPY